MEITVTEKMLTELEEAFRNGWKESGAEISDERLDNKVFEFVLAVCDMTNEELTEELDHYGIDY